MAGIVFILGAGASYSSGGPLMTTFFDKAEQLRHAGDLQLDAADYNRVRRVRAELRQVFAKAHIDVGNLEAVYNALEMSLFTGRLGAIEGEDELRLCKASFESFIVATLENSIRFPIERHGDGAPRVYAPQDYRRFAALVDSLTEEQNLQVGIITFNYDIALDYALQFQGARFDYCLNGPARPGVVRVCKLHGSLNWTTPTEEHRDIAVVQLNNLDFRPAIMFASDEEQPRPVRIRLQSLLERAAEGDPMRSRPFIVPPTDSKFGFRGKISHVWRAAADLLSEATTIVVSGFSLPSTDEFFRSLYAVGSIGPEYIERFWVIDPSEAAAARFQSLLSGPAGERFVSHREEFGSGIYRIAGEFGVQRERVERLDA